MNEWNEAKLRSLIEDGVEESLRLEYKRADSLSRQEFKKKEITKDVSAMANSAGGIIIYGVMEYDELEKRHLPQKIDPIDNKAFSREWLDQVIGNIQPPIDGLVIHPVRLNENEGLVCYVVDIPEGNTAHQAQDHRYYQRHNFESVSMYDYQVRLVMNKRKFPDIEVNFGFFTLKQTSELHEYELTLKITNIGTVVANHFMLEFSFPSVIPVLAHSFQNKEHISKSQNEKGDLVITYRSRDVLFPKEVRSIGKEIVLRYKMDRDAYSSLLPMRQGREKVGLNWKLYADEMPFKEGFINFSTLNNF